MVDVGDKPSNRRLAIASAEVKTRPETAEMIERASLAKGDALAVARVAGIQAAKWTPFLIPLCHPLPIEKVGIDIKIDKKRGRIHLRATVQTTAKTGVEMEAIMAVSMAAIALYDMAKSADRGMVIGPIQLEEKQGGKSGAYNRK